MKKTLLLALMLMIVSPQPWVIAEEKTTGQLPLSGSNEIRTKTMPTMKYEEGLSKIQNYIKLSDFKNAEELTREMLGIYPGNTDFQLILAKIYSWQGKYQDSIQVYQDILQSKFSPEVKTELDKVLVAKAFEDIKNLKKTAGSKEYEQKLKEFYESGKDPYNSGYLLGMHYIENRDYNKAEKLFYELKTNFPKETDLKILYLESLIDNKNYSVGKKFYDDLKADKEEFALINAKSEDLIYRLKNNYFQLKGGYYIYPPNIQNEREVSLELSQQVSNFTFIPRYSNISRYGFNDNQFGLDVYSSLGEKRYGYLSMTACFDSDFLPLWTLGADISQGIGNVELSLGYTRMTFQTFGVNLIKPGIRVYLPFRTSIEEKFYFVPDQLTYSLLSTLYWEPNHKFNAFYTFGFGQLAEKISSSQDFTKLNGISHTLGVRYRFMPELSVNGEFLYNHREKLYDVTGASVYIKYWW